MNVSKKTFGVLADGSEITLWTIDNGAMSFSVCDYGCLITSILLPAKGGGFDDVVLGFSTLEGYTTRNKPCLGALVGRYANRIANAQFTLNGKTHTLDKNHGRHCLHGGFSGYHKLVWNSEKISTAEGAGVRFTRTSRCGEQGFPGNLELELDYLLTGDNKIVLRYHGKTDAETPVNLTNHSYFNLKGESSGSVAGHQAKISSDRILEVDADLVPTGRILPVDGTVFDFRTPKPLGKHFEDKALALMKGGYDAAYLFEGCKPGSIDTLPLLAEITEPDTGRVLHCRSNLPCMQLYTSCGLDLEGGKNGHHYEKYAAFCLETQEYTNAPNIPDFPSSILKPNEVYDAATVYGFSWSF